MVLIPLILTFQINQAREQTVRQREHDIRDGKPVSGIINPAKPWVVVTLPSLVEQWNDELGAISNRIVPLKYYGNQKSYFGNPIKDILTRDHEIFDGKEENIWKVVVTTPMTLAARHGPSALMEYRLTAHNYSQKQVQLLRKTPANTKWKQNLEGLFDVCVIDEAHSVKNPESASHLACKWLKPSFYALATATPDINSSTDISGYVPFIAPKSSGFGSHQHLDSLHLPDNVNPFDLDDDHAGAILRLGESFFKTFIAHKDITDEAVIGQRLRKFYQQCMIRRTFVSVVDGKRIADAIPALRHRRAICEFEKEEYKQYQEYSAFPLRKLIRVDKVTGKRTWNWKHYRLLLLLSTWIGFYHIQEKFTAKDTLNLLKRPDLLKDIVQWYCKKTPEEAFPDTLEGQLALIYRGAPKIRALMNWINEVVIKGQEKMVIFTSLPGQQVLLSAILKALNISTAVYHAHLSVTEKSMLQKTFNREDKPMVLIGSYAITSCGLNLQHRCHFGAFLDPPPSKAIGEQAGARIHRVGQEEVVDLVTFSTKGSFNDRQYTNNLRKAMPGLLASLNQRLFGRDVAVDVDPDDEEAIPDLGEWVNWNGTLVPADSPELPENHGIQHLAGWEVLNQILSDQMGTPFAFDPVVDDDEFGIESDDESDDETGDSDL